MRKQSAVLTLFLVGISILTAQNVVSSGGGDVSNGSIQLEQTIGELVVDELSNSSIALEQGFQNTLPKLGVFVSLKTFLQGPYDANNALMNDDLRTLNLIPTTSPYIIDTSEITDANVLSVTGNDAIVDWVMVEIRDRIMNQIVIAYDSGLLQRDGDIVDVDGVSPLQFDLYPGNYSVSVNHRNHLGIITDSTTEISSVATSKDFTNGLLATSGSNALAALDSGIFGMYAGDVNQNGVIDLEQSNNDLSFFQNQILNAPGNIFQSVLFTISGYNDLDINLDGDASFQGNTNSDGNLINVNILNAPSNIFGARFFTLNQNF